MELERGITGIQGRKDHSPEPPLSDLKAFRSRCHVAARIVGAKIQSIQDPREAAKLCNYAMARFEFSDCVVAVLLNLIHPIVAFAKYPVEGQIIFEYIDHASLAQAFRTFGEYAVATGEELSRPLVREMCKELSPTELKRVGYFRPARVGDVIFNYWD
jgi:hypothetical protein